MGEGEGEGGIEDIWIGLCGNRSRLKEMKCLNYLYFLLFCNFFLLICYFLIALFSLYFIMLSSYVLIIFCYLLIVIYFIILSCLQ